MKNSNRPGKNPIKIENKEWIAFSAISAFVLVKILIAIYGSPTSFQDSDFSPTPFLSEPISSAAALEILLILLAAGCLCLTYLVCAELFGRSSGSFSVLLATGTVVFLEQSSTLLMEIFSIFFALAAVYFFLKKSPALSSAAVFASLFFRPLSVLLALLFASAILLDKGPFKSYLKICLPVVFMLFLASAWWLNPPDVMKNFGPERILVYFSELVSQNLFYAFLPIGFVFLLKDLKKDRRPFLLIGYLAIELVITVFKHSGPVSLILPSAAISGYGFYRTLLTKTGTSWKGTLITLAVVLMAVLTLINLTSKALDAVSIRF